MLLLIARQKSVMLTYSFYFRVTRGYKSELSDFIHSPSSLCNSQSLGLINNSNFIPSMKFDGGGELCPKITYYIQIIIEAVRYIGYECHIEITTHCERLQWQPKNQNQSCILDSEQEVVSYSGEFDSLTSIQFDSFHRFHLFVVNTCKNHQKHRHLSYHVDNTLQV